MSFGYQILGFGSGVVSVPPEINYLVVAGGGAGGAANFGGGGGAGGFRTSAGTSGGGASAESALTLTSGTTYTITIGAGGTAHAGDDYTSGVASSIAGSDITNVTTVGGGKGGGND